MEEEEKTMYLHIGNGETVKKDRIIGIFDLDSATVSQTTRRYLAAEEKKSRVVSSGEDLPKCFLLLADPKRKQTQKKAEAQIQLLRISSVSLRMRAEQSGFEEDDEESD